VNIRLENDPYLADDPNSSGTWDCQLPAITWFFCSDHLGNIVGAASSKKWIIMGYVFLPFGYLT